MQGPADRLGMELLAKQQPPKAPDIASESRHETRRYTTASAAGMGRPNLALVAEPIVRRRAAVSAPRVKDPERVRLGRLGALTQHATGKTNTGPARAAWEAGIIAEVDPEGSLSPAERARRADSAMRVRMTRLAMTRWAREKRAPDPLPWR